MQRLILLVAGILVSSGLVLLIGVASPASAEPCHLETRYEVDEVSGQTIPVTVRVGDCPEDGPPDTVPTGPGSGSTGKGCLDGAGKKIFCVTSDGVWFSTRLCYAKKLSPQPQAENPLWGSHKPDEGSIWTCGRYHTGGGPLPGMDTFFVADGQEPAQVPVDPRTLADRAFDQMTLETAQVHTAPTPPDMTYVGLETWLWTGQNQYASMSMTVSAGPTSVTVTAEPTEVVWTMGDGEVVACGSAGRPWVKTMGDDATTDCSHTYTRTSHNEPGGAFAVTARLDYQVDWTCSGLCIIDSGTLGEIEAPTSNATLRVGERQSVVVSNP